MAAFGSGQRCGTSIRKKPVGFGGSVHRMNLAGAPRRVGFVACDVGIAFVARSSLPSGAGADSFRRDGRAPGGIRRRDYCRRVLAAGTLLAGCPHKRIAERTDKSRSRTHRMMWSPVGSQSHRVCMSAEDRDRSAGVVPGRLCASRPAVCALGNYHRGVFAMRTVQMAFASSSGHCVHALCTQHIVIEPTDVAVKTFTH